MLKKKKKKKKILMLHKFPCAGSEEATALKQEGELLNVWAQAPC